jgi:hypothetical protein
MLFHSRIHTLPRFSHPLPLKKFVPTLSSPADQERQANGSVAEGRKLEADSRQDGEGNLPARLANLFARWASCCFGRKLISLSRTIDMNVASPPTFRPVKKYSDLSGYPVCVTVL